MTTVPDEILDVVRPARRITVLTGAGMSAESGIPTFRDAQTGLWTKVAPEDLATPQAWHRDPARVWAWYAWRTLAAGRCLPHAGHRALAQWARRDGIEMSVVTQNVDNLHERAGSPHVTHLHGSLFAHKCDTCGVAFDGELILPPEQVAELPPPPCSHCFTGRIRPDIVWFGEALDMDIFDSAVEAVRTAELLLVVGTSGIVYPAAGLPSMATQLGIPVIEINPHGSDISDELDHAWEVTAAVGLPALLGAL